MAEDIRTQQRWLVIGVAALAILFILVIVALIRSIQPRAGDPHIGHRSPAARLAYCGPQDTKLCVVSFGQIEGGDMQVNLHLPQLFYPEFVLVINRYGVENAYVCKQAKDIPMGVTCSGASQVPGEMLQFKIIAEEDGLLLAEGKFQIIGIAISTPEELLTATPTPTATATGTPTALTRTALPTPTLSTPGTPGSVTPTSLTPALPTSYPPPSYP
jgi:hypothetical protein